MTREQRQQAATHVPQGDVCRVRRRHVRGDDQVLAMVKSFERDRIVVERSHQASDFGQIQRRAGGLHPSNHPPDFASGASRGVVG